MLVEWLGLAMEKLMVYNFEELFKVTLSSVRGGPYSEEVEILLEKMLSKGMVLSSSQVHDESL